MRRLPPIYPLALVVTGIVTLFVNAGEPLVVLPRPLIVAMGLVLVVQVASSLVLRSPSRGALATAVLLLLLAGLWPLAIAVLALPAWWLLVLGWRRLRAEPAPPPRPLLVGERVLNAFSVALLILGVGSGLLMGGFRWYGPPPGSGTAGSGPNIYLVQLDGYPRLDSVRDRLGINLEAFAQALETRGFAIASNSHSNYSQTWATLASLFDMTYLEDEPGLLPAPPDLGEQRRRLQGVMNRGRAIQELRSRGYRIATQPSAFTTAALLSADRIDASPDMNEFEELLLRKSGLMGLAGDWGESWAEGQARGRIESGIDSLGSRSFSAPTLFYDHILAPHPPFLFEADGSATPLRPCYPASCPFWVNDFSGLDMTQDDYATALADELSYVNGRLLESLDRLTKSDPTAVVILFADHGMRFDPEDTAEHFENFFAARTPGKPEVFDASVSLVNVFPELFNAYFGESLATQPYRAWQSSELPLDLTRVGPPN